jgi:hypothetical protein
LQRSHLLPSGSFRGCCFLICFGMGNFVLGDMTHQGR